MYTASFDANLHVQRLASPALADLGSMVVVGSVSHEPVKCLEPLRCFLYGGMIIWEGHTETPNLLAAVTARAHVYVVAVLQGEARLSAHLHTLLTPRQGHSRIRAHARGCFTNAGRGWRAQCHRRCFILCLVFALFFLTFHIWSVHINFEFLAHGLGSTVVFRYSM